MLLKTKNSLFSFFIIYSLLFLMSSTNIYAEDNEESVAKVVYHADFSDPRRFSAMLTSINNMITYYNDEFIEYDVRIVFVAHGIRFITDNKLIGTSFAADKKLEARRDNIKGRLMSLNNVHGVKLELCNITRKQVNLSKEQLYKNVESVHSGVVQVAKLQSQGFAYIKIE